MAPSDGKKLEIARLYLNSGDYDKAETYLKEAGSQEGYVDLAQALLEKGDIKAAEVVIARISDEHVVSELLLQKQILMGETSAFSDLMGKKLYLSRLLYALNTRNYDEYVAEGSLGTKFQSLFDGKHGVTQTELEFTAYLVENNHRELAKFMLDRIITEKAGLADAHIILSRSAYLAGDYGLSLEEADKAISLRPNDLTLYQKAADIATQASQPELAAYYLQKILYLQNINR